MNAVKVYRPVSIQNALDDFDRILGSFFGESPLNPGRPLNSRIPLVDILENDEAYILEAELPGLDEKSVEIHVEGKNLSIASNQKEEDQEKQEKTGSYVIQERRKTAFNRSFVLPDDADTDSITASFRNGLLSLNIKKRPEAKRRVVKIQG